MNVSARVQACTEHGRKPLPCFFIYHNFKKLPLGVIQDINNRVALYICKNMLNPSNVKNLSKNFKNIAI